VGRSGVVPVVIFLRPGARPDRLALGGDCATYLHFHYLACDLYRLPASDYLDSDNLVVRLNLPNMAHPAEARLEIYAAAQAGLATLETNPEKQSKYADFIDYYADLSDAELACYTQTYLTARGDIMGLAQTLRSEGHREGWQEGRQEGRQAGQRLEAERLMKRLVERRFGVEAASIEARLDGASLEQLEGWLDCIMDAPTLDALFGEVPQ